MFAETYMLFSNRNKQFQAWKRTLFFKQMQRLWRIHYRSNSSRRLLNFPSLNCRLKMFLYMGEITPCQMAISTLRTWQTSVTALTFTIHVLGAPIDFSFLSFFHYSKRLGGFSPFRSVFHDQAPKKKKKRNFLFVWQIKVSTDAIARPHAAQWHARGKICLEKTFLF